MHIPYICSIFIAGLWPVTSHRRNIGEDRDLNHMICLCQLENNYINKKMKIGRQLLYPWAFANSNIVLLKRDKPLTWFVPAS